MTNTVFLNGELLAEENAKIAISDRGFLLGDGLFETIRYDQNKPFKFESHWSRLANGSKVLGIPLPLESITAQKHIHQLLRDHQLEQMAASVRITLTRGSGPRGLAPAKKAKPTVMIQCFPIPEKTRTSISVMHSDIIINEQSPLRQFKSLAYAENILARQRAVMAGYDDALLYNSKGFLVSATCANIFLVIDHQLVTPPIEAGALPGIMRQHILEQAKQLKIPVSERNLCQQDCQQAQNAFISNSIIQLTPIHQLGSQPLALPGSPYNLLI